MKNVKMTEMIARSHLLICKVKKGSELTSATRTQVKVEPKL